MTAAASIDVLAVPEFPRARDFRLTKIICTLGPSSATSEVIHQLATAGMNIARLNMSHGDHKSHWLVIRRIKSLNRKLTHPIVTLLDLKGPEIRTGERETTLELGLGEIIWVTVSPNTNPEEKSVHVDYRELVEQLKVKDRITVDNGLINLEVLEKMDGRLRCRVLDGGPLGSRRHVNVPGVRVNLPSVTAKDRQDIEFGVENDVDYIAMSFVRCGEAVREAKELIRTLGGHARIIAKIENQEGVDQFDEILEAADGIMVARGDLGVEVPMEELPSIQRSIVRRCALAGKPVIVATHLLESMTLNPMPTRAEITDVANAVYEQVDAVMLSGETATGKYPVRCVEVLDRIARRTEKEPSLQPHRDRRPNTKRADIARSACRLADSIGAPAIVVITRRGLLAELVASFRPERAIVHAFTNMSATRRKLWLLRSVVPFVIDFSSDPEKTIQAAFDRLRQRNRLKPNDPVVVVSRIDAGEQSVTSIQVRVFR